MKIKEVFEKGVVYEIPAKAGQVLKKLVVNPFINYFPRRWLLWCFKTTKSPLLKESLRKAGSWQTMRISYENKPPVDFLDKLFLKFGSFPMGLRNRKRLVVKKLVDCIEKHKERPLYVMGVGAGPGTNIIEALERVKDPQIFVNLLDLDSHAFDYGKELAKRAGLAPNQVNFIQGDVIELESHLKEKPHILKMIGIIEYLTDDQVQALFQFAHRMLKPGGHVVVNSISNRHGHDRFMKRVFKLHLRYRKSSQIQGMLLKSGFLNLETTREPMRIYSIIVGEKEK